MALLSQGATGTVLTPVIATTCQVAVSSSVALSMQESHPPTKGAEIDITLAVVPEVFYPKYILLKLPALFFMEKVIFDKGFDVLFFKIGVVFFTAIACISGNRGGEVSVDLFKVVEMGNQVAGIGCFLVNAVADNELVFRAGLDIICRF